MIQLVLSKEAQKLLLKLNTSDQKKISKSFDKLQQNPLSGEKLKGEYAGLYKIYAWPYRVIYNFDLETKTILIVTLGHRQGIYKRK